ncbi:MAG: hypothetical protein K2Q22_14735, partial [Cytophagales bacterium]|nr:hypothetical protein [Cytophagales bacterium]
TLKDKFYDLTIDENLNVYATGSFNASQDGIGTLINDLNGIWNYSNQPNSSGSNLGSQIIISKFSPTGTSIWTTTLSGNNNLNAIGYNILYSKKGGLYVASSKGIQSDSGVFTRNINFLQPRRYYNNYFYWSVALEKINIVNGAVAWSKNLVSNSGKQILGRIATVTPSFSSLENCKPLGLEVDSLGNPILLVQKDRYSVSNSSGFNIYIPEGSVSLNSQKFEINSFSPSSSSLVSRSFGITTDWSAFRYKFYKNKFIYVAVNRGNSGNTSYNFTYSLLNKQWNSVFNSGTYNRYDYYSNANVGIDVDSLENIFLAFTELGLAINNPYGLFCKKIDKNGNELNEVNVIKQSNFIYINSVVAVGDGSAIIGFDNGINNQGLLVKACFTDRPGTTTSILYCPKDTIQFQTNIPGVIDYTWTPTTGVS